MAYLSPSQIKNVKACGLREVFNNSFPDKYYLPENPVSLLGTTIHKVLEQANKKGAGSFKLEYFDKLWNKVFKQAKDDYFKNELNSCHFPLEYNIPYFAVKKIMTKKIVEFILRDKGLRQETYFNSAQCQSALRIENEGAFGFSQGQIEGEESEKIVEFEFLKGKVDVVTYYSNRVHIRDYKTGSIFNYGKDGSKKIKEEYFEQLKTYGLIYRNKYNLPARGIELSLIEMNGRETEVFAFTEEQYDAHYLHLRNLFGYINEAVNSGKSDSLANPSLHTCSFCRFRPVCNVYKLKVKAGKIDVKKDVCFDGFIIREFWGKLCLSSSIGPAAHIRNIPLNLHDELYSIQKVGSTLFAYNLYFNEKQGVFYWTRASKLYSA